MRGGRFWYIYNDVVGKTSNAFICYPVSCVEESEGED